RAAQLPLSGGQRIEQPLLEPLAVGSKTIRPDWLGSGTAARARGGDAFDSSAGRARRSRYRFRVSTREKNYPERFVGTDHAVPCGFDRGGGVIAAPPKLAAHRAARSDPSGADPDPHSRSVQ